MKITLTTERGERVSFDLAPGENAWITTDADPEEASRSLYLDTTGGRLGTGEYDEEQAWWDWRSPLDLTTDTPA